MFNFTIYVILEGQIGPNFIINGTTQCNICPQHLPRLRAEARSHEGLVVPTFKLNAIILALAPDGNRY